MRCNCLDALLLSVAPAQSFAFRCCGARQIVPCASARTALLAARTKKSLAFTCKGRIQSVVPPKFLILKTRHSFTRNARHTAQTTFHTPNISYVSDFFKAATVGNSSFHLNLRKLSAGDFLSLKENETLLYTINAFGYLTNSIS